MLSLDLEMRPIVVPVDVYQTCRVLATLDVVNENVAHTSNSRVCVSAYTVTAHCFYPASRYHVVSVDLNCPSLYLARLCLHRSANSGQTVSCGGGSGRATGGEAYNFSVCRALQMSTPYIIYLFPL